MTVETVARVTPSEGRAPALDPIVTSVIGLRLEAVAKEMAVAALRTTRSSIFNLVGDFITAITDARGRTLAHTEYAAIIAYSVEPSLAAIIERFEDISDGDVFLHNDVFTGGNQNHDLGVFVPVFADGVLVAWSVCKGHQADMGGSVVGGYDPSIVEVWQEAFRIPPIRYYEAGRLRSDLRDLIAANVRLQYVMDDLDAMIGACRVGARGIDQLIEHYGTKRFAAHSDELLSASARTVTAEIATWPRGVWQGESIMVSDGIDPFRRYRIACELTIDDDGVCFDYSATDDQAPGFTNMPASSAMAGVRIALLMVLAAGGVQVERNHGLLAPVRVVFREGSLLNPTFPAATMFGNQMCDEVFEAAMVALSQPLPERVTAGWNQALGTAYSGIDPRDGNRKVFFGSFNRGGAGAMSGADGHDALGFTGSVGQTRTPDVESYEIAHPIRIDRYERWPDSAGAGRWRGGYGTITQRTLLADDLTGSTLGDDVVAEGAAPGPGLAGGEDAGLNTLTLTAPDGSVRTWGSKERIPGIVEGTLVTCIMGGGAGYGNPFERPAEAVLSEVLDGLCSVGWAALHYGVVVDPTTGTVDRSATEARRSRR